MLRAFLVGVSVVALLVGPVVAQSTGGNKRTDVYVNSEVTQQDQKRIEDIVNKSFDFGVTGGVSVPGMSAGAGVGISIKSATDTNKAINMSSIQNKSAHDVYKNWLCDAACDVAGASAAAACSGLSGGVAIAACIAAAGVARDQCHKSC